MECKENGETLESFLDNKIFADAALSTINPDPADVAGWDKYIETYKAALKIERTAVENL